MLAAQCKQPIDPTLTSAVAQADSHREALMSCGYSAQRADIVPAARLRVLFRVAL